MSQAGLQEVHTGSGFFVSCSHARRLCENCFGGRKTIRRKHHMCGLGPSAPARSLEILHGLVGLVTMSRGVAFPIVEVGLHLRRSRTKGGVILFEYLIRRG